MNDCPYGDFADRRDGGVYNALNRVMIGVIILGLCLGGILAVVPLLRQRAKETLQIEQLRSEVAKKKTAVVISRREFELLKNDPAYIEIKARDRLDLMKPGETIIRFESSASPSPVAPRR